MRQREPALPFGAERIARAQAQRTFDHRHPTVGAVFLLLLSEGLRVLIGNQVLGVDITKSVKLQLRDLSRAEQVYADPFPSRFEFARAQFGRDHLSIRSGRAEAFAWPTVVRVGLGSGK